MKKNSVKLYNRIQKVRFNDDVITNENKDLNYQETKLENKKIGSKKVVIEDKKHFENKATEIVKKEEIAMSKIDDHEKIMKYNRNISMLTFINCNIFKNLGVDIMAAYEEENRDSMVQENFLEKHNVTPQLRKRFVDWVFAIANDYKGQISIQTIHLTMALIDKYLATTCESILAEEFKLIGMTCLYIASKVEDIIPLHVHKVAEKLCKDKYKKKQIADLEQKILTHLKFKIFTISSYDYIEAIIADFESSNRDCINQYKLNESLDKIRRVSIFFSKIMLHFHAFCKFK